MVWGVDEVVGWWFGGGGEVVGWWFVEEGRLLVGGL